MTLHPQAEAFLGYLKSLGGAPIHTLSPAKNRRGMSYIAQKASIPAQAVAEIQDCVIPVDDGKIKLRVYKPADREPLPVLVFFHGGGWVMGDLDAVDAPLRALTNAAQTIVVSVDYRLAPEYKFPTAVNDCYAALKWVAANARALGADADRIAVGGESAGGNLATVVTLMAREHAFPRLHYQVLIYPVTDISGDYPSKSNFAGHFIGREDMSYFESHYLRTEEDRQNIHVSPLLAELHNLPPALVVTAGYDPLHDEGASYARRLKEAGVDVTYYCYEDMIHGFLGFAGMIDQGKDLIDRIACCLRKQT